jgi:HSP20 family protein
LFDALAGFQDLDRLMQVAFRDLQPAAESTGPDHPRVDLYEDKDGFHFRAELPGVKRDDIHVELGEGVLTLSGTREAYAGNGEATRSSAFSRSISVPARVKEDQINAGYENGVLTVTLPKAEEVKPKRIAVEVK